MKQAIGNMMFMVGASLTFATLDATNVVAWLIILLLTSGCLLLCIPDERNNSLCETETHEVGDDNGKPK